MKLLMDYQEKFQPITWIRYYLLLFIYIQIRFILYPIIVVGLFILLYIFIALSMAPLNYRFISTSIAGKIIYWIRFLLKVSLFFILSSNVYSRIIIAIIIIFVISLELITDLYLYLNIRKFYDIDSFEIRNEKIKNGVYMVLKKRKIAKYLIKIGILICVVSMISSPIILYKMNGIDELFILELILSEFISISIFILLYVRYKKLTLL